MHAKIRRVLKTLILLFLVIFNVFKGNFVNIVIVPYVFSNYGISEGCLTLVVVTMVVALVQLKCYDRLNKSFMHNEVAVERILTNKPQTFSQGIAWVLVRFVNRYILLVGVVTVLDPFISTAFFRDLKVFNWSQTKIFMVSLIIGTMTTTWLILRVWSAL